MADRNLANKIINLREEIDMTQTELARRLGLDKSAMSKVENGTRKVSSDELSKLSEIFDVSTDYLLGRNNTPQWADKRDTTDLKKFLDDDSGMTYDGDNLTEEENEQLRVALTQIFWKRRRAERKISRDTEENL